MSKRKPISQREAMRMRKRIKELENHIRRLQGIWGKINICSLTVDPYQSGRMSLAEDFGNIMTIHRHPSSNPHTYVVHSVPMIELP